MNKEKEEKNENEETKHEQENSVKITVTKEAAQILLELVDKANDGFEGGKINRQALASFIIDRFKGNYTEVDFNLLRQSQYDDMAMLEAMYRKMKETGKMPEFLRTALRAQFQIVGDNPKKAKKPLIKSSISDVVEKNEAA